MPGHLIWKKNIVAKSDIAKHLLRIKNGSINLEAGENWWYNYDFFN